MRNNNKQKPKPNPDPYSVQECRSTRAPNVEKRVQKCRDLAKDHFHFATHTRYENDCLVDKALP